ncbi:EAL domain-containing protein [Deinococcus roseus]|uniref:EAL domain-containing protein n=1 Tax=Deinococcus roseus TaxID=392414 RepID=A0ABQ2D233_9DEIO|nr:EAL domain-containing protein [Deinococcus roseus]GGJ42723.1 hypothetical protein GCM10008938_31100 [Deinococcus roseus]
MTAPQTVAILMDYLADYQIQLLKGYHRALDQAGLASTTFVGREVHSVSPHYRKANDVYTLLDPGQHLGVIITAASMGNFIDDAQFAQFAQRFSGVPVVALGRKIPGIPSILIDNRTGMRQMMEHLIVQQGHRSFVFVRGTRGNSDSQLREEVVRECLQQHGLELPDHHVLQGDFFGPRAASEIKHLLQQGQHFDVVVCANDDMALGVIHALEQMGLRVPLDVAVVGFDDIEDARYCTPPLTTVRQPIEQQAERAVQLLLDIRAGQIPPEVTHLDTELVVRQSCGGMQEAVLEGSSSPGGSFVLPAEVFQPLLHQLVNAGQNSGAALQFLKQWQQVAERLLDEGKDAHIEALLYQLETAAQTHIEQDPLALRRVAYQAASLLQRVRDVRNHRRHQQITQSNHFISQMELSLTTHPDLDSMYQDLTEYARMVQVQRYALVLYDTFGSEVTPQARVGLSAQFVTPEEATFPTRQLLPTCMHPQLQRTHLLVVPLFVSEVNFGYLVYQKPEQEPFNGDHFRYTISTGMYHVHQTQMQQAYARTLERRVNERTTELDRLYRHLQHAAIHDELTGLFNRTLLQARLTQLLNQPQVQGHEGHEGHGVVFLDVDRFKSINDAHGHSLGDLFLQLVANRLKTTLQELHPLHTLARFGGDEFAVLLENVDASGILQVAQRLQEVLREPHSLGKHLLHTSASIGMVHIHGPQQAEAVLRDADIAMYQAKKQGPGQLVFFEGHMHDHQLKRSQMESDLRQTLQQHQLEVHYQPLINLSSGRIMGFEALARWYHPHKGWIHPVQFIPIAEESGLVLQLDRLVLQQACQQVQQWSQHRRDLLHLSVNMSTLQFAQPDFYAVVSEILQATQFPAWQLRLEITESLLLERGDVVRQNLQQLQDLGVKLHIDDFGTGYSSLGYLQQFAASALKIDRSFIQKLQLGRQHQELVRTIIQMAHNLGMSVVAEGVETLEQQDWLRQSRCDVVQGFMYSHPVEARAAMHLLDQEEAGKLLVQF